MVPASSAMSTAFARRPGRAGESVSARRPGGGREFQQRPQVPCSREAPVRLWDL